MTSRCHTFSLQRASVVRCRPVCRVFTAAWSGEPVDSPLSSRGAPRPAGGEVVVGEERGGGGESCACAATGRDGAENGHRQAPLSLHSRRGSGRRKPHSSGIGTYGGTALGTRSPENRMRHRRSPDALLRRCTLRCSDSACAVSQPGCADRRGETCDQSDALTVQQTSLWGVQASQSGQKCPVSTGPPPAVTEGILTARRYTVQVPGAPPDGSPFQSSCCPGTDPGRCAAAVPAPRLQLH
nr:PREDICTED: uncharacterized protein LOC107077885 isoform X2 [Lepisosteus oculatus]